MSKNISAALLTNIQQPVQTLATCVLITRKDGKPYYLTNHDADIVFEGKTYSHSIPFITSAIDSGSQLQIDNADLTLHVDGVTFTKEDFEFGLFDHADCEIFKVDYENPGNGKLVERRGWFGEIQSNRYGVIAITVTGLLKVLDFETGRVYQPSCDADLGDKRCKVALNQDQIRSVFNSYRIGDWVYNYNTSLMTSIALTNPSFEADGPRDFNDPITGWTRGPGATMFINDEGQEPSSFDNVADLMPAAGTYAMYGYSDATDADSGFESYVYQDVDLVAAGISATDIDDGKISFQYLVMLAHTVYSLDPEVAIGFDPVRLRVEVTDANGDFVATFDTRPINFEETESWYERAIVGPLYPNARFLRIFIYLRKEYGTIANNAADNARLYWWDHTVQTPYDDVVHRAVRLVNISETNSTFRPSNHSFEADANFTNTDNPTITGWTTGAGNWFRLGNSFGDTGAVLSVSDGLKFLSGGDNGSGVQSDYTTTRIVNVSDITQLTAARVLLGKYVGVFRVAVGFYGNPVPGTSKATVKLEMLDASNVVLDTYYAINNGDFAGVVSIWADQIVSFSVPALTAKFRITLTAHSPVGVSAAKVGFDNVRLSFFDAERPLKTDPLATNPTLPSTGLDTTPGSYTLDGAIVWKAMPCYRKYDEVAAVTDRKTFRGTTIVGDPGTYETGLIQWISGANAGLKNVIRIWNDGTQTIKMYFRQPFAIQVGDRFIYDRTCQRRFTEDCAGIFQNQINFRGFPHLPGKLREATPAENAAG